MSRTKILTTLALIVGFGGLAIYLNRDWFSKRPIQISYRVSPWIKGDKRNRSRGGPDLGAPVVFNLNAYYKLMSVKVVVAAEFATNKYSHALWNLTTTSNSYPVTTFAYGDRLRGMIPKDKGAQPEPLEPGITYRLLLTTKDQEVQHDFAATPPKPTDAEIEAAK